MHDLWLGQSVITDAADFFLLLIENLFKSCLADLTRALNSKRWLELLNKPLSNQMPIKNWILGVSVILQTTSNIMLR